MYKHISMHLTNTSLYPHQTKKISANKKIHDNLTGTYNEKT